MKAKRFFSGSDTYGRDVELALGASGQWFARYREFDGYGVRFCAWYETEQPAFETHGVNQYTGERFEHKTPVCLWGFNRLREVSPVPRVRLPDLALECRFD
jgi:hypothetical protein